MTPSGSPTVNYVGNFNFNSAEARNLTLQPEPGVTNTQITIDGAGGGRALNISSSGSANTIRIQGTTFLRNSGNYGIGALRIAAGNSAPIVVSACRFLTPTNGYGVGLELASGLNATISDCLVSGNVSYGTGVRISGIAGSIVVRNCSFLTNGPGLSIESGSQLSISNNIFIGNHSGGISAGASGSSISLTKNSFIGNTAGYGAGATLSGTQVSATGNTFTGNHSS